jgi:hypothetical protein
MNLHRRGAACLLVLLLSACSSNSDAPANGNGKPDISNVIYVGAPNDETLESMLDMTPKTDAQHAVIVDSPDLTVPVSKDNPVTFEFHVVGETAHAPRSAPSKQAPSLWRRGVHDFMQLLAPVRTAHAHGEAYNGTAYYLVITDKNSKQILQVFTSGTESGSSFAPEALDWQHLVDAPQPLTLEITSAYFENNSVPADGGPFVGGKFQFTIE